MTRRSHRKSRHGCFTCKQRRIKCDEQKPNCQKCITRDAACTYPSSTPLVWMGSKTASPDDEEPRRVSSEPSPPAYKPSPSNEHDSVTGNATLNLDNIELIIHWFTTTVHTVNSTSNPAALEICQTLILKQAMQHHFLLHGLLALSALHLADSHSDPEKYTRIAITHHTQGLALYHSILSNIDEANYSASIAFSSITIMFAFGLSRPEPTKAVGIELVDNLAKIFLLVKGWHNVVHIADGLECRAGSAIFPPHQPSTSILSTDTESAFQHLNAFNQGHDKAVYKLAISSLKSVFRALVEEGNENPHVALEWANIMPEEFLRLISERQNLALVMVGYYCVVLDRVPQVWWLRGWSKRLFRVIWGSVELSYQDILKWPREMIGIEA